jgi:hypothetical protein
MRVRRYLENDEVFLANYADGLSDLPLDQHERRWPALLRCAAGRVSTRCRPGMTES